MDCANMSHEEYVRRQNEADDAAVARRRGFEAIEASKKAKGTWTEADENCKRTHDAQTEKWERDWAKAAYAASVAKDKPNAEIRLTERIRGKPVSQILKEDPSIMTDARRDPLLAQRMGNSGGIGIKGWLAAIVIGFILFSLSGGHL